MKIIYTLLTIFFLIISTDSFSQTIPSLALKMGGSSNDLCKGSAMDEDGNLYIIGEFSGTADLNPYGPFSSPLNYSAVGSPDMFITRIDKNNNWSWTRVLSSTSSNNNISAIHIINKNKIVVGGDYGGSLSFKDNPATAGTSLGSSLMANDGFILIIDSLGQNQHFKTFNSGNKAEIKSITSDVSGEIYIAGSFRSSIYYETIGNGGSAYFSNGQHDFFYAKLDASYNVVQHSEFGSIYEDFANTIHLDGSGNIIISGTFAETVDFDAGAGVSTMTANGSVNVINSDMFVLKLNNSGDYLWAKQISGTTNFETPKSALIDVNNNICITGQYYNTVDFDPNSGDYLLEPIPGQPSSGSAGFLLKLDENGNFVFAKSFGGYNTHTSNCVRQDAQGFLYVIGNYSNAIFFAQSGSPFNLVSNGGSDVFACKFDGNGSIQWTHNIGGSNLDEGSSIEIKPDGYLSMLGNFSTTVDFVPLQTPMFSFTSAGGRDVFIQTVFQCESAPDAPISNTDIENLEICQFEQTTLSVEANNNTDLQLVWGPPAFTSIGNGDTIITNALSSDITYYAFYESLCGNSDTVFFEINVNPAPIVSGNPNLEVCLDESVLFDEFLVFNGVSVIGETNLPIGITTNYVNDTLYLIGSPTETGVFNYTVDIQTLCYDINVGGTITVNTPSTNVSQQMGSEFPYLTVDQAGGTYQWIDCNNGNAPISGATGKDYYPTAAGSYAVIVTYNGCTAQSDCFTFGTTSNIEENMFNFSIFPNPTKDVITVEFKEVSNLKIFAIDGKLIASINKNQKVHTIDCSEFPSGVYFIQSGNQTQKFIKE